MASYIKRGETLFIPFHAGESVSDSQRRPRIYKSRQMFESAFPERSLRRDGVELVEYAEVRRGEWIPVEIRKSFGILKGVKCSRCGTDRFGADANYCPECGAKMRRKENGADIQNM